VSALVGTAGASRGSCIPRCMRCFRGAEHLMHLITEVHHLLSFCLLLCMPPATSCCHIPRSRAAPVRPAGLGCLSLPFNHLCLQSCAHACTPAASSAPMPLAVGTCSGVSHAGQPSQRLQSPANSACVRLLLHAFAVASCASATHAAAAVSATATAAAVASCASATTAAASCCLLLSPAARRAVPPVPALPLLLGPASCCPLPAPQSSSEMSSLKKS
jgi:hypothetical protein